MRVCVGKIEEFNTQLNSWLIDKDRCSQIHMGSSADRVKMQVLTQEIHLHSKTTWKNCTRTQLMMTDKNTDMQAPQKELVCVCVSLSLPLIHSHMHTYTIIVHLSLQMLWA